MSLPDDARSQAGRRAVDKRAVPPPAFGCRPGRRPLTGRLVALEPCDANRHAPGLFEVGHTGQGGQNIWRYLPYGPFEDAVEMAGWLRGCAGSADPAFFALRDLASGRLAGQASIMEVRPAAGIAEIGHIWIGEAFQNSGLATEALYLMMSDILDQAAYRRLEWRCDAANQASRQAALRLGFRYEGTFYNHNIAKGMNRDTAWYALVCEDWAAVKANFQLWLAPENFDAEGQQRTSLGAMNRALW
tara:strand:- start:11561 stop:12295 length:735 start_codon:yes stop_codon:yes gene_type:complete